MTPRQAALLSVNSSIKNGRYSNLEVSSVIKKYKFEGLDKSFFTALFYGTVEKLITLDYIIKNFSSVKFEKIDNMVLCLLRTGIYQILFMDRVPDSAACCESVELAKRYCPKSSVSFVNAVLRSVARSKDKIFETISKEKELTRISVLSSIPEEIINLWIRDYGKDTALKIANHFAALPPSVTLRVNTLKITREALLSSLGKIASTSDVCPSAIVLSGSFPVEEIYGFEQGLFFVQDISSQLASSLINPESLSSTCLSPENAVIADVCACPGGKSFSCAINLNNKARIYASDLHENKLSLITNAASRLGISNISVCAHDAKTENSALINKCDAVICDVPCSGLGVIAKKPDIRYKPLNDTEKLPEIQYKILKTSSSYVKAGGFIVYSTCTLNKRENEDIINKFLSENENFKLEKTGLPNDNAGMITIFPFDFSSDGFFVAKLVRIK